MSDQPETQPRRSPLERFFGGHPLNVLLKLAFISLLVGLTMAFFGDWLYLRLDSTAFSASNLSSPWNTIPSVSGRSSV